MMFKNEMEAEHFCLLRHPWSLAFHSSPPRGSGKGVGVALIMFRVSLWLGPS